VCVCMFMVWVVCCMLWYCIYWCVMISVVCYSPQVGACTHCYHACMYISKALARMQYMAHNAGTHAIVHMLRSHTHVHAYVVRCMHCRVHDDTTHMYICAYHHHSFIYACITTMRMHSLAHVTYRHQWTYTTQHITHSHTTHCTTNTTHNNKKKQKHTHTMQTNGTTPTHNTHSKTQHTLTHQLRHHTNHAKKGNTTTHIVTYNTDHNTSINTISQHTTHNPYHEHTHTHKQKHNTTTPYEQNDKSTHQHITTTHHYIRHA